MFVYKNKRGSIFFQKEMSFVLEDSHNKGVCGAKKEKGTIEGLTQLPPCSSSFSEGPGL